jgi:pimeloyl-ACP methyl ester carboxylesterase
LELLHTSPPQNQRKTPLLFVHGFWQNAHVWEEHFLPHFTRHGYACYAISLRGHGASPGKLKLRWTSLSEYVTDVHNAIREIGMPPVLIGHSMGGAVVQKYLEYKRVPGAVLLASVPPRGLWGATLRVLARQPLALLEALFSLRMYPIVSTPERARRWLFSRDIPLEVLLQYHSRLQDDSFRVFLDLLGLNLPNPRRVSTPVLVLGAAQDAFFSGRDWRATARAYSTEAVIIPRTAHNVMLEPGWQVAAGKILDWLAEQDL